MQEAAFSGDDARNVFRHHGSWPGGSIVPEQACMNAGRGGDTVFVPALFFNAVLFAERRQSAPLRIDMSWEPDRPKAYFCGVSTRRAV